MKFKAKIINGKPVIKAKVEKIKNNRGGYDIVVHLPSLDLISKIGDKNGKRDLSKMQS